MFDVGGWDVRKVIQHLVKSNAVMLEWLYSGVVYRMDERVHSALWALGEAFFNPVSICWHYLSMARNKLAEIQGEEQAKIKRYCYVLRPLACIRYIQTHGGIPHMEYQRNLTEIPLENPVREQIELLLTEKVGAAELHPIQFCWTTLPGNVPWRRSGWGYNIMTRTGTMIWQTLRSAILLEWYMAMHEIKRKIAGSDYEFLRENQDLKQCIYLTFSGSYGYGTNTDGSDIDLRGVLVEPPQYLYGLERFEQFEDLHTDTVIYGLKKYVSLCMAANPNALELLGTDESCIVLQTPAGKLLREHAHLFLSRRVIGSFGNYATAQLRRFSNALCHDSYDDREQEKHLANILNAQIDHFNRTYTSFGEEAMRIYQDEDGALRMDLQLEGYPVRDFVGIYGEMHNTIKTYNKLNHRNRKKDDAHLYKHAMHLIRLLITGMDILEGKGIITWRDAEHDFLIEIRSGAYGFEQIKELAEEYQARFRQAAERTALPKEPDRDKVEQLIRKIYGLFRQE